MLRPLKITALALFLGFTGLSLLPGCQTPPSARVVQVQTLKAVGESAEAAVALSAQLYQNKQITQPQAKAIADFYDQKFQPAYRLAVAAVNANLDAVASPDVLSLANQLSALVIQYQNLNK